MTSASILRRLQKKKYTIKTLADILKIHPIFNKKPLIFQTPSILIVSFKLK